MLVQRAKTPGEDRPKSYIWRGTLGLRHGKVALSTPASYTFEV